MSALKEEDTVVSPHSPSPVPPTVQISVEDTTGDCVDGETGPGDEGAGFEWEIIEVEVENNDNDKDRCKGLVKNSPFLQRDRYFEGVAENGIFFVKRTPD